MTTHAPLISDTLLAQLANPSDCEQRGEYGDATRAMLAIAVPEMAQELQARRRAQAIEDRVQAALKIIHGAGPVATTTMATACETILDHCRLAHHRDAARAILNALKAAA